MLGPDAAALASGLLGLASAVSAGLLQARRWKRLGADLGLAGARVIRWLGWPVGVSGQLAATIVSVKALTKITTAPGGHLRGMEFNVGGLLVEVDGRGQIPGEIELSRTDLAKRPLMGPNRRDVELGDPAFDELVCARGPDLLLMALLNHTTRPLVFGLVSRGGSVVGGAVRLPDPQAARNTETPGRIVGTAIAVARRLHRPEDVVGRVCAVARQDPQPGVRQQALALLTDRVAEDPRVRELCRELLAEAHEGLRLQAASCLGEEGCEALLAIARHCQGDNPNAVRAIRALGRRLTSDGAAAILSSAAPAGWRATTRAAIDALALSADARALDQLALLVRQPESDLAAVAAQALGRTGTPAAERSLLEALGDPRPDVRLAAAEALGQVGSAVAVEPLRSLAASGPSSQRRAAREAIARIQSRLPGATPGQLSIAAGQEGRLSMADDRSGRVSVPQEGPEEPS